MRHSNRAKGKAQNRLWGPLWWNIEFPPRPIYYPDDDGAYLLPEQAPADIKCPLLLEFGRTGQVSRPEMLAQCDKWEGVQQYVPPNLPQQGERMKFGKMAKNLPEYSLSKRMAKKGPNHDAWESRRKRNFQIGLARGASDPPAYEKFKEQQCCDVTNSEYIPKVKWEKDTGAAKYIALTLQRHAQRMQSEKPPTHPAEKPLLPIHGPTGRASQLKENPISVPILPRFPRWNAKKQCRVIQKEWSPEPVEKAKPEKKSKAKPVSKKSTKQD